MVRAGNETCVKHIRQDGVNDYFQAYSFQFGHVGFYTYPRTMGMTEMDVANYEFPLLDFEEFPNLEFPN